MFIGVIQNLHCTSQNTGIVLCFLYNHLLDLCLRIRSSIGCTVLFILQSWFGSLLDRFESWTTSLIFSGQAPEQSHIKPLWHKSSNLHWLVQPIIYTLSLCHHMTPSYKRRLSFISCHVIRSLKKQCFKSLWSAAFPIFMWFLFRDCSLDFFRLVLKLS